MLHFFRKYQTYFFAVITVVIIISFSFFGTYNTLPANAIHDQIAFTAVDGTEVKRSELDELVLFLNTDNEDKKLFGGVWGPNFLNNGVIRQDFLSTGLAEILIAAYPDQIARDLQTRLEKEKRYTLYQHPHAKFLTAEAAWAYFAPKMKTEFDTLRNADRGTDADAVNARIALFLEEKRFPAPLLRQVLRYQQKQYNWLTPDPSLDRSDLSLFGYHTLDDWFGPRFLRLVGEFIINSSKIAEQKGYVVTKGEAFADLMANVDASFQQNINNPQLGVTNSVEYFNEQLRRLGMDQNKAIHLWQQVLLFRRLFQDIGNAALVDALISQKFQAYSNETVVGDLYRVPAELRFSDYRTLQKFEVYLDAVAKRQKEKDPLALPTVFLSAEEVSKKHPELTQKRYLLEVAEVQKSTLYKRVGLKEMWNWEVEDKNWSTLTKEFPELGVKAASTREERSEALDSLNDITRSRVDLYARKAIAESHPEWLEQLLSEAESTQMTIGIRPTGGNPILGLADRKELIDLLDKAPLPDQTASKAAQEASDKLASFTGDKGSYYRIRVLKRTPTLEVLTFTEANKAGVLDPLVDHQLEVRYVKIRETNPQQFQKEDKTWKALADVKDLVADYEFEKVLSAIRKDFADTTKGKGQQPVTGDLSASVRFYAYLNDIKKRLQQGKEEVSNWVRPAQEKLTPEQEFEQRTSPQDQWKLESIAYQVDRSNEKDSLDKQEFFTLAPGGWSTIHTPVNGDLYFFHLSRKESPSDVSAEFDKQHLAHRLISDDAQRSYMHRVLGEIKEKNAISLEFLDRSTEMTSVEEG